MPLYSEIIKCPWNNQSNPKFSIGEYEKKKKTQYLLIMACTILFDFLLFEILRSVKKQKKKWNKSWNCSPASEVVLHKQLFSYQQNTTDYSHMKQNVNL